MRPSDLSRPSNAPKSDSYVGGRFFAPDADLLVGLCALGRRVSGEGVLLRWIGVVDGGVV
jgi:hypothetical protein